MKGYCLLLAVVIIVLSACSRTEKTETNSEGIDSVTMEVADSIPVDYVSIDSYIHTDVVDTSDTDIIDFDCAVLIYPTEDQIEYMKQTYGNDDFYTLADDSQFYQAAAIEKLDSAGIAQVVSNSKRFVTFKGNSKQWTLDVRKKDFPEWNIIFFKKEKTPKVVFAIDMNGDSIRNYFNK